MKPIAFLLLVLLARPAFAAPCDAADSMCLIRQSLELSYELEACKQREAHLKSANDAHKAVVKAQEPEARIPGSVFFLGGVSVGVVATVLTIIALR